MLHIWPSVVFWEFVHRPQGDRRSYKQWQEDNIPPQVVFEIASPSNTITELEVTKLEFYSEYGAQEYYVYDPDTGRLKGWLRQGEVLTPIEVMEGWISPQLGIRFEKEGKELQIYRPDGERFATYVEILEQKEQEATARQQAEQERDLIAKQQQEAIPRLLKMGLTAEQISDALSLPLEVVEKLRNLDV
ncbi:MAG: hypothetical protein F6K39_36665 [Okeania sp. SIO3B3]|nr:hypothetical protein [Okeania sp. SIO3B3]